MFYLRTIEFMKMKIASLSWTRVSLLMPSKLAELGKGLPFSFFSAEKSTWTHQVNFFLAKLTMYILIITPRSSEIKSKVQFRNKLDSEILFQNQIVDELICSYNCP